MTTVTVGVTASITHFETEQLWYIKPLPKPVVPEKRVVLAPASFLASLPPNSPHTCCKVAAILFTKILAHSVNHLGRGASLQVMLMCWWMTDDHHPDQSFARHQNAGHPKCCTKPLLSLLLLVSAPFQLLPLLFTRLCSLHTLTYGFFEQKRDCSQSTPVPAGSRWASTCPWHTCYWRGPRRCCCLPREHRCLHDGFSFLQ